ncbi:SDR family NAD(P)-dependent oxidoreductase [Sphingomonas immobilis]|uniref:SDR family oxidoreductase n=1 Tax=Sphingomonas immobilis TaxID=3063997 RepID=A0ABT8ZW11_9SPHN|nr:SDR family oxidoreductase [Sphingomonas sp. CA1-15]MDO7841765.1 SDR family oxidoreductase [Sphingomonas sp. CA1-15]
MRGGHLADRRALITGAGSGLGAAIAGVFAREGARLVLVDRNDTGLTQVAGKLGDAVSHTICADLSDASVCDKIVQEAVATFGGLDILVNNAAILHFALSPDVTPEMWDKTLAVNLSAPFHLIRSALPHLLAACGNVVNIASSGAIIGTAYTTAYSTAKAGLIHMTKCLAMEYARQPIRINAVAPGAMRTNIGTDLSIPDAADRDLMARYSGLRPAVDPIEVAELVAFVASPRGSAVHGACLSVDGGVTAG